MKKATARVSAGSSSIEFDKSYGTGYCIPLWLRDIQVKMAIKKVDGRVEHYDGRRPEPVAIVGYGPSLKQTWQQLRDFKIIFTTSGAHKFLVERGIIPTYHVDVDPRAHKVAMLGAIRQDVTYMPCSTCHPNYIDTLLAAGASVKLWHCFSTEAEALRILPQGEHALTGGCDAGMRAMAVARFMGYANQHVFGMDGCSLDESGHADQHTNPMKKFFDLEFPKGSGKVYRTSPGLMEVAKTVPHEIDMLKLDSVTFYGDGLVKAIVENREPAKPKESNIAFAKPTVINEAYRRLLAAQHNASSVFGSDGFRYVDIVKKLMPATKSVSVLDYGCGKGTLAAKLDFPIWEYDPAIEGKDVSPKPADLVICTNVLECVEPENLEAVLLDLVRCVKKVGYFTMGYGSCDHWEKVLGRYFHIGRVTQEKDSIVAVLGPKVTSIPKKKDKLVMVDEVRRIEVPSIKGYDGSQGLIHPARMTY